MTKEQNKNIENWIGILLGAVAILAIKSIFENDNSKIVSNKGRKILSDTKKMNDINKKIQESESENEYSEIYI
jgi:flagellar motor component MotA